ncbi:nuclear RNA-splicing-associated protein [Nitzschia inconspicua]|uniref:ADP-ribosylation factor-like protein 6-interacting protein 4 n=1 Tax=Nitzschia inconspicua TaxID=303405 RepID=A0A9K3KJD9_9STRA|nr:nuclear RNA-splicing-associated protein [Nitzschia inconspicua]
MSDCEERKGSSKKEKSPQVASSSFREENYQCLPVNVNNYAKDDMVNKRRSKISLSSSRKEKKKRRRHRDEESDSGCSSGHRRHKREKKEKKKHRRKRSYSRSRHRLKKYCSSSETGDSDSEDIGKKREKQKKNSSSSKTMDPSMDREKVDVHRSAKGSAGDISSPLLPVVETTRLVEMQPTEKEEKLDAAARRMVPMTREQYLAQQAQVREVYDPETGRMRLVRGNGEIIERIVSRERHLQINQQATRGDGASFSRMIHNKASSERRF